MNGVDFRGNVRFAHYSVDDVWKSLFWLTEHRPSSLFDIRFFCALKRFHEKFGAKFTLYCIIKEAGYSFFEIPDCYSKDFSENADWLRFGFHSVTAKPFGNTEFYQESFFEFERKQEKLGMGKADILRLHSWKVREDQAAFLRDAGISAILYPDEAGLPYDENGVFVDNEMLFWRTDIWLEKSDDIEKDVLRVGEGKCAVFTHEWCFDGEMDKMESALAYHKNNGCIFL